MTEETTDKPVVDIDTDAAKSKTRAFFARHKNKFTIAATVGAGTALFLAGRASKDVVEDVDVTVTTPDESDSQS